MPTLKIYVVLSGHKLSTRKMSSPGSTAEAALPMQNREHFDLTKNAENTRPACSFPHLLVTWCVLWVDSLPEDDSELVSVDLSIPNTGRAEEHPVVSKTA